MSKKRKDPAFLFYPNDWAGGTMGMTYEEKGAYMDLLIMQFNRGHMTSHMIGQTVGKLFGQIEDKFEIDSDGKYFNERLESEIEKRRKHSKQQSENVQKRWNKAESKSQKDTKVNTKGNTKGNTKIIPNEYQKNTKTIPLENENENENGIVFFKGLNNNLEKEENARERDLIVEHLKDLECNFIDLFMTYLDFLRKDHSRDVGMFQVDLNYKQLSAWYDNDQDREQCLRTNIANGWKTLNHIKPVDLKKKVDISKLKL